MIREIVNDEVHIKPAKNNLDNVLSPKLPSMFPHHSGFTWCVVGWSGSGKTTLLYSLMTAKAHQGKRQSYKQLFNKIYVVSPTMAKSSMKNDPFSNLPPNQIHREVSLAILQELDANIKKNREDDLHSVIIFDDVSSQLRKKAEIEKYLEKMLQNRRHDFCSYFILVQKFKNLSTGIRSNMSHISLFRPKNNVEKIAICSEMFPYKQDKCDEIMKFIYEEDKEKDKHSFLYVDMSLKKSSAYIFHKNFNELVFDWSDAK